MQSSGNAAPGRAPRAKHDSLAPALAAGAFGLAWFLANGGGSALSPVRVAWLLRVGDPAQHWLGWAFFRNEAWGLPLGTIRSFAEPVGTTVGFTDAIPAAALLFRPLSALLPADFQYLGPWLALCFFFQGFFGARIAAAIGGDRAGQFLGGALFALSPALLWRLQHEALAAHWILLALLALALHPVDDAVAARRGMTAAACLALLAAAVHPMLALAAFGLAAAVAASVAIQGRLGCWRLAAWFAWVVGGEIVLFIALGYFSAPLSARGFGYFSADLLAFVNPMGWSRFLPTWPTRAGQGEGYAYLGAGCLVLLVLALASRFRPGARMPWRRILPIVAVCVAFALVAVSTYVTLAGRKLLGTSSLPPRLEAVVGPFRASGRFIWPMVYLVVAAALAGTFSLFARRPRGAHLAISAAVVLQVADLGIDRVRQQFAPGETPTLDGWTAAANGRRHLALFPPHIRNADGDGCGGRFGAREVALAYRAYRLGLGFNSGYLSRMDLARVRASCAALGSEVARGELRADTIYVPDPGALAALEAAGATCGVAGTERVCVAPATAAPPGAELRAARRP